MSTQRNIISHGIRDNHTRGKVADFLAEKMAAGKRGGLRVIYYWWDGGSQFWLFTLYDKDEMADLSPDELLALRERLHLSRPVFARYLRTNPRTLENWEQGRPSPMRKPPC